jgi:fucose 4-O-acetylase-like acetyltransferase
MNNRDVTLDIAKGICILLMVAGHSGCPGYLGRFIYMFHMPCFFFVSGWLLSDAYLDDLRKGLWRKLKGAYWPFVKWELLFLTFHNAFAVMGVYRDSYGASEFASKALRILTFTGGEQLLGGYWFLISLCWASVGSLLMLYALRRWGKLSTATVAAVIALVLLVIPWESRLPVRLPAQFGEQTLMATAFYLSGYLCKRQWKSVRASWTRALCLLLCPALAAIAWSWNIETGKDGLLLVPFFVTAMAGTLGTLHLSACLLRCRPFAVPLTYIGERTLYVLTFHFLGFKCLSAVYIALCGLPHDRLAEFPGLSGVPSGFWLAYVLAGVGFSLVMHRAVGK